jgi:LPS-assembly protein
MKKMRLLHLLLPALLSLGALLRAQEGEPEILVDSLSPRFEVFLDPNTGLISGTNGVVVRYGPTVLIADAVTVDQVSGDAHAEGNVSVQHDGFLWRGERLRYNLRTREMGADDFRTGWPPFFAAGKELISLPDEGTNRVYEARNAYLTTDDVPQPALRIRARSLRIIPGKSVSAHNATLLLGNVPVFYFPYFRRSLDARAPRFEFTPGFRTRHGAFLRSAYIFELNDYLEGALNLDAFQKRGLGFGPDLNYDLGLLGQGSLSGYYIKDQDPGRDPLGQAIRDDRHRISFSHRATLRTNLTATAVVHRQSDAQIIRDFYESEYRENPQPKSFLELSQLWPNFSLSLLAQPQLNDFFQTVERLPDLKFSGMRQQLGVSPFYYESESSAGYFRFQSADQSGTNYSALRADTFHQLLLPQTFFGWLNFTPRVGGRFTHYGETDMPGPDLDSQNRGVFNTGAELSFKASRLWSGARSKFWDMDGLRHIIEPSINYVFVPSPSARPRELPQFDTEIPSLRLLPVDFPDYNAIDSIDSQNVLRLGLFNKVQTKRGGTIDNLVNWRLMTDWRIDRQHDQATFADLFSDLDFRPRSWMTLSSETRFDVENGIVRFANHGLTLTPGSVWSLSLGHLYVRESLLFGAESENNLLRSSFYYRLNENWGWRMTHHFEGRDGTLEEQYYTVYRDLRSLTAALTVRLRDNRIGPDDFTIALTLSLKAYPRFKLGRDRDQHSLLLGG